MTINSDGTITFIDENQQQVQIKDITKNSDVSFTTYYDTSIHQSGVKVDIKVKFDINFSSDSSGTMASSSTAIVGGVEQTPVEGETINIVKK